MKKINDLESLAKKYRREMFEKLLSIKQGHPGSIFSMKAVKPSISILSNKTEEFLY